MTVLSFIVDIRDVFSLYLSCKRIRLLFDYIRQQYFSDHHHQRKVDYCKTLLNLACMSYREDDDKIDLQLDKSDIFTTYYANVKSCVSVKTCKRYIAFRIRTNVEFLPPQYIEGVLKSSIRRGYIDGVRFLIDVLKADFDSPILKADYYIGIAYGYDRGDIIKYFVDERRVNLNSVYNARGLTLLHNAVEDGLTEYVEWLIEDLNMNVDVRSKKDGDYMTPLHVAAHYGRVEVGKLLISKHNANIYAKTEDALIGSDENVLHIAVKKNKYDFVKMLESFDIDFDIVDGHGNSVLHHAVISFDMVSYVLDRSNVNVNKRNNYGQTALHMAVSAMYKNAGIVKILIEKGADVNAKDNDDKTPLYVAVENWNIDTAKLLILQFKADVTVNGQEIIDLAKSCGMNDIVNLISDRL